MNLHSLPSADHAVGHCGDDATLSSGAIADTAWFFKRELAEDEPRFGTNNVRRVNRCSSIKWRRGLTLVELLVTVAIVGILVSLMLPAVQSMRESARRTQCGNNLRQIGVAVQLHESRHRAFPYTALNYGDGTGRVFPAIAPHRFLVADLDPAIFDKIDFLDSSSADSGEPPWSLSWANAVLLDTTIPSFLCPSDYCPVGGNNYRANLGPGPGIFAPAETPFVCDPGNTTGAFANGRAIRAAEFSDGLSNTALFSEKVIGDGNSEWYEPFRDRFVSPVTFRLAEEAIQCCRDYAVAKPKHHDSYSGFTWLYGGWNHTWYNHILGPNTTIPDCSIGLVVGGGDGIYAARSFHPGGVNVLLADGGIRFVNDSIDLLIWRAISTRRGRELVNLP